MSPNPIQTLMGFIFLIIPIVLAILKAYLLNIIYFDLIVRGLMKYFEYYHQLRLLKPLNMYCFTNQMNSFTIILKNAS